MDQDEVFKALSDPHRRTLLDALFQRDGQSLNELSDLLPMTRYGVMKHLQVLEVAGLITSEKVGREKHHYLNAVPIQMVYERWVSKYAQPWAQALTGLKNMMEVNPMLNKHIQRIFIQTTPEDLWRALTNSDLTKLYYFGSEVEADWQTGGTYRYPIPEGGTYVEGEVIEIDPPHKLVTTFRPVWQYPDESPPVSRVTWIIDPIGTTCKLTLVHENLDMTSEKGQEIIEGWSRITSGLKTLLETGQPINFNNEG
ncbi:MAG: ArsR/SmtB family transcription factor [Anaerolineae bacterium]